MGDVHEISTFGSYQNLFRISYLLERGKIESQNFTDVPPRLALLDGPAEGFRRDRSIQPDGRGCLLTGYLPILFPDS